MKRAGFTMIELIFVIVILGILAAVAIPKLAATRDDAAITKMAGDVKTAVADAGSYYTSQGATAWAADTWGDATNVHLATGAATMATAAATDLQTIVYLNMDDSTNCFTMISTTDGNVTVANGAQIADVRCAGVLEIHPNIVQVYEFGGITVSR